MSVDSLLADSGPDIFYTPAFRNVLEDHLPLLRERHSAIMTLRPDEAFQWRGDFYGLLRAKGVPRHYHWLIMRLNQMTSPRQFHEDTVAILQPDTVIVDRILQSHNAVGRIS